MGTLFWVLMILWALFGVFGYVQTSPSIYIHHGRDGLMFVLLALLGWKVYGPAIQG